MVSKLKILNEALSRNDILNGSAIVADLKPRRHENSF